MLWTSERSLEADSARTTEGGAFRFAFDPGEIVLLERRENSTRIFEDGKLLLRVGSRKRLPSSQPGCYAWAKSSLLVIPHSDQFGELVIRFGAIISSRTKAVVFGATLLALVA
ncbi:MAG: hypothetical protein AAGC68_14345, partial [Verrucomicrobiota bacterium]